MVNANGILHHIAVAFPRESPDDEKWAMYAGRRMAARFGKAFLSEGKVTWGQGDEEITLNAFMIHTQTDALTDLDLSILYGIALQVAVGLKRRGVAVLIDDDGVLVS